ncbi:hypothetical protein YC2023_030569 [Brassica napus]
MEPKETGLDTGGPHVVTTQIKRELEENPQIDAPPGESQRSQIHCPRVDLDPIDAQRKAHRELTLHSATPTPSVPPKLCLRPNYISQSRPKDKGKNGEIVIRTSLPSTTTSRGETRQFI